MNESFPAGITFPDKEKVLARYPGAYVRAWSCGYMVVRPRTTADRKSLLSYVPLSFTHKQESNAWKEATDMISLFP